MAEAFSSETQGSVERPPVPPSAPPLNGDSDAGFVSSPEIKAKLSADASRESRRWQVLPTRTRCRPLEAVCAHVSESVERVIRDLRSASADLSGLDESARWLVENARLVHAAISEARQQLPLCKKIPQVRSQGDGQNLPRAYRAAQAFFESTACQFDERSFEVYFDAVQESGVFEIGELWALRPLLQLVLVEQIAAAAVRLAKGHGSPAAETETRLPGAGTSLPALIASLREIVDADWQAMVERLSPIERELGRDADYPRMDFESRNLYRGAIQELARHSKTSELEIARKAVGLASLAVGEWNSEPRMADRRRHVGYYLIDKGRNSLERLIAYRPPPAIQIQKAIRQKPEAFYLVGIELVTFAIVAFVLNGLGTHLPLLWALLLLLIPASESAIGVMNQLVSFLLPVRPLPKLDFSRGIPGECTTMVAVPALLISEAQVHQMVKDLEVRYCGNCDPNLHFALLTDSADSPQPLDEQDALARLCSDLIQGLNEKYRGSSGGSFFHLHRALVYNPSEGTWMGWERKRGKLLDLNNLLRGRFDSFPVKAGDLSILPTVRYVITLDADTGLPRDVARRLVGALAHPLNRAVIDPVTNTVVEGYGILQPRVGISVRSANRSRLANIYSGQSGFDIYTRAVSDVYQDLMEEGSFTGKGIYEVDVFQRVLSERFPLNAILSHDLIEGAYARAGLASDIEIIDDYPSHFSAYSRRKHRWVRGDWQIMRWLLPRVPDASGKLAPNPIKVLSRWKILDNLRRSLVESATFVLLLAGWFALPGGSSRWTAAVLALLLIPAYLRLLLSLASLPRAPNLAGFLSETAEAFIADQVNVFMLLAFLAHQALVTLDAIVRTIIRLTITRRRLLEWETAAESEAGSGKRTPVDLYLTLTPLVSAIIAVLLVLFRPHALPVAAPILVLWACSGVLSRWLDRPLRPGTSEINKDDRAFLREAALRTWRFFRAFSNAEDHWLIPDNVQEQPAAMAQSISPTNLGLLLDARVAACELGYVTLDEFVADTERSLATMRHLPRYNGHFFNWYDTRTLQPIEPLFVSSVDSGNLACCLWTLKQACLQMVERPLLGPGLGPGLWQGLRDHARMVAALALQASIAPEVAVAAGNLAAAVEQVPEAELIAKLPELEGACATLDEPLRRSAPAEAQDLCWWVRETAARLAGLHRLAESLMPWLLPEYQRLRSNGELGLAEGGGLPALKFLPAFLRDLESRLKLMIEPAEESTRRLLQSLGSRLPGCISEAERLERTLNSLAEESNTLVREMDFGFLYHRGRKTLSIGYNVSRRRLEKASYDLLASEARIAIFVAIAKGDVPQEIWARMGRPVGLCAGRRVLLSWSGTMFEYLMPSLWMRTYPNTMLDYTLRSAVRCQQRVSKQKQIPWGISESACAERDASGRYGYFAFGLRALSLRPTARRELVISPYSSWLALSVNTTAAVANLRSMEKMGWLGRFGFYESADFSAKRPGCEVIQSWMAHHQGMILLSVCNLLAASAAQNAFHAEPMVAATERLLHETFPRAVVIERSDKGLREAEPSSA